jgi:hypothetical protein
MERPAVRDLAGVLEIVVGDEEMPLPVRVAAVVL